MTYSSKNNKNYASGPRLSTLIKQKECNEIIPFQEILAALVNEAKFDKNYGNAETIFYLLLERLNNSLALRPVKRYIREEVITFQKSISTMIHYAPNPHRALNFSAYLLKQDFPLRTENEETSSLMDLIFVYSCERSPDSMDKALELIKLGIERHLQKKIFHNRPGGDNVTTIFLNVSKRVLDYHNLQLSVDKSRLEPILQRSTRPNRFSTN